MAPKPVNLGLHVEALERKLEAVVRDFNTESIWPEPYCNDKYESAIRFLYECVWTWNESNRLIEKLPRKDYIEDIVWEWFETRRVGKPFIIKKTRRMIVSWIIRSLDTWDAGLKRCSLYLAGQKYERSAGMLWRNWFLYDILRIKRPEFKLPELRQGEHYWRYQGPRALSRIIYPNGSYFEALSGDSPDSFRQEGATRVTCEEIAFWPYIESAWGNAKAMVQGKPGEVSGHLVAISTVSGAQEWKELVRPKESSVRVRQY